MLSLVFLSFFVSALAFSIGSSLDMTFEMLTPTGQTASKKKIMSACLFFLLCCVLILACFILSLFWEILKVVLFKMSIRFSIGRVVLLVFILVASGIWAGVVAPFNTRVYFTDYVQYFSTVIWVVAFVLSVVGAIILIIFVFAYSLNIKILLYIIIAIVLILVAFSVISAISFGIIADASAGVISFVLLLPICVALLAIFTYFRGKKKDNKTFIFNKKVSLLFLGLFLVTIILLTSVINAPTGCTTQCQTNIKDYAQKADRKPFSTSKYSICRQRWSSINLNIAELAFIANMTYNMKVREGNSTAVEILTNDFFTRRNIRWKVKQISNDSPNFLHLQSGNVSIIGVRGSVNTNEFIESAKMWDEAAVFQSVSIIVPFLQYLPMKLVAEYVSKSSFLNKIFHGGSTDHFFKAIEDYVKVIIKTNSSEVMLVGHSLGGGVAKIIGARQKIPAVSFSSPGIGYEYIKFSFSLDDAIKYVVTIVPDGDLIPGIDKMYGQKQIIKCSGENFVQCHLIGRTYCELHHGCGIVMPGCESIIDN